MAVTTLADRIRKALHIESVKRADGPWTKVSLSPVHIPAEGTSGPPLFIVTTELAGRLSAPSFDRDVAAKINSASRVKGRVLFGVDAELQEVVAAVAYHVPLAPSEQVMVTAIAVRVDAAAVAGRACALVVKACLHEIGAQLGRGGQLSLRLGALGGGTAVADYGFRPGPRGRSRSLALFVQDAPD